MKVQYFKKGKVHFQIGLNEIPHSQSTAIWDMSRDPSKVTCKRCLKKLKETKTKAILNGESNG